VTIDSKTSLLTSKSVTTELKMASFPTAVALTVAFLVVETVFKILERNVIMVPTQLLADQTANVLSVEME